MSEPAGNVASRTPGGPPDRGWQLRAQIHARIAELWTLADSVSRETPLSAGDRKLLALVDDHLAAARAAAGRSSWHSTEQAAAHTDAAEIALIKLVQADRIRDLLPGIAHRIRAQVPLDDPRRMAFDGMLRTIGQAGGGEFDRGIILAALSAANVAQFTQASRMRSFRAVLAATNLCLLLACAAVGVLGAVDPGVLSLCFGTDDQTVCPLGHTPKAADVLVVEALGLCGAALMTPRWVRTVLAGLLPLLLTTSLLSGALLAVLGLLLMSSGFVPGVGGLDSQSQILAWGFVFGLASPLLTKPIEVRCQQLLAAGSATEDSKLAALLDERLAEEAKALSAQVSKAVSRTVEESLRGPELIAFLGAIQVIWHVDPGISGASEGQPALALDGRSVMRVAIRAGVPVPSGWEELSVAGRAGEVVGFRLVVESDGLTLDPGSADVAVRTSDGTAHVDFEVHAPPPPGRRSVWISVYQYGRLVQVLTVPVLVSAKSAKG